MRRIYLEVKREPAKNLCAPRGSGGEYEAWLLSFGHRRREWINEGRIANEPAFFNVRAGS